MSYTGTQVYYPPSTTLDTIGAVLAAHFPEATLSARGDGLSLRFDGDKVIDVSLDAGTHVPEEARWLGERADVATRSALEAATHRVDIFPHDPRADPDAMYDELLSVFEALYAMEGAVGADPFDGSLYHQGATVPKP